MSLNKEYKEFSEDILNNDNFLVLKNDVHHGTNKYDHCKRVSYLSFLFTKLFKGNSKEATRAGLLHDFFYGSRTSISFNAAAGIMPHGGRGDQWGSSWCLSEFIPGTDLAETAGCRKLHVCCHSTKYRTAVSSQKTSGNAGTYFGAL